MPDSTSTDRLAFLRSRLMAVRQAKKEEAKAKPRAPRAPRPAPLEKPVPKKGQDTPTDRPSDCMPYIVRRMMEGSNAKQLAKDHRWEHAWLCQILKKYGSAMWVTHEEKQRILEERAKAKVPAPDQTGVAA